MKNKFLCFIAVAVLLSGCSIALETVRIPSKSKGWKVGNARDDGWFGKGTIVELVPVGENINDWTKLISIQFFEGEKSDLKLFMSKLKQRMESRCKNTKWEIIEETESTVFYDWQISDCAPHKDQHELVKLLKGNDGLHRAAYTEKKSKIDSETYSKWKNWISEAYVTKDGNRVVLHTD